MAEMVTIPLCPRELYITTLPAENSLETKAGQGLFAIKLDFNKQSPTSEQNASISQPLGGSFDGSKGSMPSQGLLPLLRPV